MRPSVGRIVHYHTSIATQAAIITQCYSKPTDQVDLTVFTPGGGMISRTMVREGPGPNQWSWPPRIDESSVAHQAEEPRP